MKYETLLTAALAVVTTLSLGCKTHNDHHGHTGMSMESGGKSWGGKSLTMAELPAPVQTSLAAALAAMPGAKVEKIMKEEEEGKTVYEVEMEMADTDRSMKLAPDGAVLEEETEVELTAVPSTVTAAVKARYQAAKIEEAWIVKMAGKSFYELDVEIGEDNHEIKVTAEGTLLEDKKMADEEDGGEKEDEKSDDKKKK